MNDIWMVYFPQNLDFVINSLFSVDLSKTNLFVNNFSSKLFTIRVPLDFPNLSELSPTDIIDCFEILRESLQKQQLGKFSHPSE